VGFQYTQLRGRLSPSFWYSPNYYVSPRPVCWHLCLTFFWTSVLLEPVMWEPSRRQPYYPTVDPRLQSDWSKSHYHCNLDRLFDCSLFNNWKVLFVHHLVISTEIGVKIWAKEIRSKWKVLFHCFWLITCKYTYICSHSGRLVKGSIFFCGLRRAAGPKKLGATWRDRHSSLKLHSCFKSFSAKNLCYT